MTSTRKIVIELAAISFFSLFLELMIIRWLSSEIRTFAYFKNVPLMACLFGLGVGLALSKSSRDWKKWVPFALLGIVSLICFADPLKLVHITIVDPTEYYIVGPIAWKAMDVSRPVDYVLQTFKGYAVLMGVYYLLVLTFIGVGQKIGSLFDQLKPLQAYTVDIAASLLGVFCFSLMSFFSLPPGWWMLLIFVVGSYFFRKPLQISALLVATILGFATADPGVIWSPYYRISVRDGIIPADGNSPELFYGYNIDVNHDGIMGAYDNRPETVGRLTEKQKEKVLRYYDMLYDLIGSKPRTAMIIAAGAGNDLACGLRHGLTSIDAVELDKTFIEKGKKLHPEKPYDNPAVTVHIDDARAYMQRCQKKYDLVDFAYLDAHAAFSSMSSIRLDNYIYTEESFKNAKRLLNDKGILAVTFYAMTWWQEIRVFKTIEKVFGEEPLAFWSPNGQAVTILIGPGLDKQAALAAGYKQFNRKYVEDNHVPKLIADWDRVETTTDDWPFLFLRGREMSLTYCAGLLFTLLIGWGFVRRSFGATTKENLSRAMFCLGAGFMLLEVKSVSQMGLVLGATWLTNAFVISAVLFMILIANLIQLKCKSKNLKLPYICIFVSLVLSYFIPISVFAGLDIVPRTIISSLFLALPIPFAAWIFAITFSNCKDQSRLLGMNLLGTLVGGAMEYVSMITGIAAMNLLALVLYALAFHFTSKAESEDGYGKAEPELEPETKMIDQP
ncbi:MAG: hypothetical protein K2Y32_18775 [Candidatus Obscuribacterales bacterium]|nr:hypothetical protein [Candidatus Obscuribacterales bacterium]